MSWLENSIKNILPLSKNNEEFKLALKEWFYTGDYFDNETATETCELCEHPELRYQFKIVNNNNGNELLIGSECINKFDIVATDIYGKILSLTDSKRKVHKDKLNLIARSKKRNMTNALVHLARVEHTFDINSFIDYVHDRGAFTPRQLLMLFDLFQKHKISVKKADFKIVIKRDREKDQLLTMKDSQITTLWDAMTSSQKEWFRNNI